MPDAKGANDSLKGAIRVWQRIGACLVKTNVGVKATRKLDHRRGEIATRGHSPPIGGCTSEASGTGRNVEQASIRNWLHGIEQGSDSVVCHRCKKLVIASCDTIMRVPLEFAKCISVNLRLHR
jgi:hypothetical protein